MKLNHRKVLVIGGSSGIGLGIAEACAAEGAAVWLVGRDQQRLAGAATRIAGARTHAADVTDEPSAAALFAETGPLDHVVVTAVTGVYAPVRELALADARRSIDSKLILALNVAKHARITHGGCFVFTTGVAAHRPAPGGTVIAAINGAMEAMVRALALELAPLRVNAICPGWIDTPFWDRVAGDGKSTRFEAHAHRLPVGRVGAVTDTAHAALFLLTNGFTTGEVLHVDGGHRLV